MAMRDPESIVKSFIEDYQRWNDRANARCEQDDSEEALEAAEAEWHQLLSRYCRPGFNGEAIAFGSDSNHHPDRERIVSVQNNGSRSVVMTINTGSSGFEARYEYLLVSDGGTWFLEAVDYVDADGNKVPSL